MEKRKKRMLAALLALGMLTACGPNQEQGASQEPSAPPAQSASAQTEETQQGSAGELRLLTSWQGIAGTLGGETAQGCYSLDCYPDGTADIIYYDYASAACIRLSADPSLGHDPVSTAYIPSYKGGARCLVSGENLYVIKNGQPYTDAAVPGNDPMARLYCMGLDGSNRKILEYGTNVVFQWDGGVAGDEEGNLYTVLSVVDRETVRTTSVLAKLGREVSGYQPLHTWEEPVAASLIGVCDEGFVVRLQDRNGAELVTKLVLIQPDGTEESTLLEWTDLDVTSYTIHENVLYYTKNAESGIYSKNVLNGQELPRYDTEKYEYFQPALTLIRCEVRDNHLILQLANPKASEAAYAALDLSTGALTPLNMYYGEGEDKSLVGVYAEGEEDFLVCVGSFTRTRTDQGPDGVPYSFEQGFEDYVLIKKATIGTIYPTTEGFHIISKRALTRESHVKTKARRNETVPARLCANIKKERKKR